MITTTLTIEQTPLLIWAPKLQPLSIYLDPAATNIYIGGSDVTTSNGLLLTQSVVNEILVRNGQALYAISAAGSNPLIVFADYTSYSYETVTYDYEIEYDAAGYIYNNN
jgi:hypothetical protein